ncbi:MAG TPA: response regulator transcription factor [Vicinamibacterales bacterium]
MTRVIIVVGVRLYREGLAQLLSTQHQLKVVATAADGGAAAEKLAEVEPDVALVEMGVPDVDRFVEAVAKRSARIPLVALGISGSDTDVIACAEKGAAGFVTCDASLEELTGTIQRAAEGELLCSPRTAGTLMRRLAALAAERRPESISVNLTRREQEVAALMREDLSNKEIATRLRIEVATVKNHVHNVLDKLRVHRRTDAAKLLFRRGG